MSERWKRLSVSEEIALFEEICEMVKNGAIDSFSPVRLSQDEADFRSMMCGAELNAVRQYPSTSSSYKYKRDIDIGLALYKFFEDPSREFSTWESNDRHMWSYLSLKVVPDIIFRRGGKSAPIPDLYYRRPARMYLRKLWWFMHLSLVEDTDTRKMDVEKTKRQLEILREQDANELMDRSAGGFHLDFSRTMMSLYSEYCRMNNVTGTPREDFFRALIHEHHLRMQITSPELEGKEQYFKEILKHAETVLKPKIDEGVFESDSESEPDDRIQEDEVHQLPNDIAFPPADVVSASPPDELFRLRSGEVLNVRDIIAEDDEEQLRIKIREEDVLKGMSPAKVNEYLEQWFGWLDNPYDLRSFLHYLKDKWAK